MNEAQIKKKKYDNIVWEPTYSPLLFLLSNTFQPVSLLVIWMKRKQILLSHQSCLRLPFLHGNTKQQVLVSFYWLKHISQDFILKSGRTLNRFLSFFRWYSSLELSVKRNFLFSLCSSQKCVCKEFVWMRCQERTSGRVNEYTWKLTKKMREEEEGRQPSRLGHLLLFTTNHSVDSSEMQFCRPWMPLLLLPLQSVQNIC